MRITQNQQDGPLTVQDQTVRSRALPLEDPLLVCSVHREPWDSTIPEPLLGPILAPTSSGAPFLPPQARLPASWNKGAPRGFIPASRVSVVVVHLYSKGRDTPR